MYILKQNIGMKTFLFILGKNPGISLAEIACCMEAFSVPFRVREVSAVFLAAEADGLPEALMNRLGGTLKIAEVFFSAAGNKGLEEIAGEMERKVDFPRLFRGLPEKAVFGMSTYATGNEQAFFSGFFKDKMRDEGIKAGCIGSGSRPFLQHTEVVKKHLVEKSAEFVACSGREFYMGRTVFVHNPFEFQKRDVGRPAQRTIYSLPPRLCRIMINMAGLQKGVLLDPFCGIGSILQEAALMGLDIRGIDIDKNCVNSCIKNLSWLDREYRVEIKDANRKILSGSSDNLANYFTGNSINAIVTEPYLGPPLKKRPGAKEAGGILGGLEGRYRKWLRSMLAVLRPRGRIVIVSPCFRTGRGIMQLDVEGMAKGLGATAIDPLKRYNIPHSFPFLDYSERHRTLRKISIIEKQ